jgi:hypothetical protein
MKPKESLRQRHSVKSVWERIADAYDHNKGLRLSAEDVETLYLLDTAVRDAGLNAREDRREALSKP